MKLFLISVCMFWGVSAYAEEPVVKYEDRTLPELNEQLRKLDVDSQITSAEKLDLHSHPIDNVEDPTDAQDAATKNYVDTTAQPLDADLTAIGALAKTDSNIIVGNGSTWVAETGDTARTSLGLAIGTNVQAYDAQLADLADGQLSGASTVAFAAVVGVAANGANTDITSLGGITTAAGSKNICNTGSYAGGQAQGTAIAHELGRTPVLIIVGKANADDSL